MGTDFGLIFSHFIVPPVFAITTALVFVKLSFFLQTSLLFSLIFISNIARLVVYAVHGGKSYIIGDAETQLYIVLSFIVQFLLAGIVLLITIFFSKKR